MKPNANPPVRDIAAIFSDAKAILDAVRVAGKEARRRHKLLGHPIVEWRDGKVVQVPPTDIVVDQQTPTP